MKMINAAGELAAEVGLDNVSTRAVADRSGENIGSIHYHFGGKDGLFEAVVREAMKDYMSKARESLMADLASDPPDREAFSQMIRSIVAGEIDDMFRSGRAPWHSQVIYQLLQRDDALYELFRTEHLDPSMDGMYRFFKLVDPAMTNEDAFLHAAVMKMPIFAHANYMKAMLKRLDVAAYSEEYLQKLEDLLVSQTQWALGLPLDKPA
ncbi:TetR/AcrR family transcriptional regulator [Pontiella sulfatireligans]|nr:TetR/AcrR family transcriptional regulator [Pontiella sulfatireligans]